MKTKEAIMYLHELNDNGLVPKRSVYTYRKAINKGIYALEMCFKYYNDNKHGEDKQ